MSYIPYMYISVREETANEVVHGWVKASAVRFLFYFYFTWLHGLLYHLYIVLTNFTEFTRTSSIWTCS